MEKAYIFLSPDGTQDTGLLVIVAAETGIVYASQVYGVNNDVREIQGFAVPVGHPSRNVYADNLLRFFKPYCYTGDRFLPDDEAVSKLKTLVAQIPFWKTIRPTTTERERVINDELLYLELDMNRIDELVYAWIPVKTAYGPGILTFNNCD